MMPWGPLGKIPCMGCGRPTHRGVTYRGGPEWAWCGECRHPLSLRSHAKPWWRDEVRDPASLGVFPGGLDESKEFRFTNDNQLLFFEDSVWLVDWAR